MGAALSHPSSNKLPFAAGKDHHKGSRLARMQRKVTPGFSATTDTWSSILFFLRDDLVCHRLVLSSYEIGEGLELLTLLCPLECWVSQVCIPILSLSSGDEHSLVNWTKSLPQPSAPSLSSSFPCYSSSLLLPFLPPPPPSFFFLPLSRSSSPPSFLFVLR